MNTLKIRGFFYRSALLFVILVIAATALINLFFSVSIYAAPSEQDIKNSKLRFVTRSTIIVEAGTDEYVFVDADPFDYDYNFKVQNYNAYGQIDLSSGYDITGAQGYSWINGTLDMDYLPTDTATKGINTDPNDINKTIGNPQNSRVIMVVSPNDPNVLQRVDGNSDWNFTYSSDNTSGGKVYRRDSEQGDACQDVVVAYDTSLTVYELKDGGTGTDAPEETNDSGCDVVRVNFDIELIDNEKYINDFKDDDGLILSSIRVPFNSNPDSEQSQVGGTGGAGSDETGSVEPSCESEGGEGSWLICPALRGLSGLIGAIDEQVNNLLYVPDDYYKDGQLQAIWSRMRNIAFLLLIPTMLIMVIGTALGFGFLDAYTVKRAMPRMLIAIIFIALSLPLLQLLIDVINAVGLGVNGMITSVSSGEGEISLASLFDPNPGQDLLASGVALGAILTFKVWIGAALLLGLTVLLSIATIFLLLALRQLLIVALVVLAPIAILAWIFPGNDKPWKLWWTSFWKLLLLYPLIMAMLAIGRVFADVVHDINPGGLIEVILKLVAYIGPFFFIPSAFKYAGGVFANLGGIVNDRERGVFDRLRKARGSSLSKKHNEVMEARSSTGKGRVGSTYRRVANFGRNGSFNPLSGGRARWHEEEQRIKEAAADTMLKEGGGRAFNDDDASVLLRDKNTTRASFIRDYAAEMARQGRGADDNERRQMAERALSRAELAVGAKVGSDSMVVAAQKFRVAMTNTAYEPGTAGLEVMQRELMDLQDRGLASTADVAGWMKANRGRTDYSSNGFADTMRFASGQIDAHEQLAGAFAGADPREIVGGHQRAVESFAQQAQVNLSDALASGDEVVISKALADVANVYDTLSSVSPRKAEEWANQIYSQGTGIQIEEVTGLGGDLRGDDGHIIPGPGIDRRTRELTVRELMESRRSNSDFLDRRREYATAANAAQAANAAEAAAPPPDPAAGP